MMSRHFGVRVAVAYVLEFTVGGDNFGTAAKNAEDVAGQWFARHHENTTNLPSGNNLTSTEINTIGVNEWLRSDGATDPVELVDDDKDDE